MKQFKYTSKRLRWDRNFMNTYGNMSTLRAWGLTLNKANIQPKNSRCDAPGYEGRISGIPYCK